MMKQIWPMIREIKKSYFDDLGKSATGLIFSTISNMFTLQDRNPCMTLGAQEDLKGHAMAV